MSVFQLPDYDVAPMIPRTAMPQVDEIYYPDMLVWLGANHGVTFRAGYTNPQVVKVHQEINIEKAMGLPAATLLKPVLLSKDGCVLDGDHRWYRHLQDRQPMPFIELSLDFMEAIKVLESYPKCYEVTATNQG